MAALLSPAACSVLCRERLRANPSLVNCCTIDWLGPPPPDALEAVAHKQLSELPDLDANTRKALVNLCQAMHVQVIHGFVHVPCVAGCLA